MSGLEPRTADASWGSVRSTSERQDTRASAPHGGHKENHDRSSLQQAIEAEIIPRLMLVHGAAAGSAVGPAVPADAVETLTDLLLNADPGPATAQVQAVLAQGVELDTVLLDLLTPAARRLGEYWVEDRCSFADVTIGLGWLQQIMREVCVRAAADDYRALPYRLLLMPVPGEQHTFGVSMVGDFFRRAGWNVDEQRQLTRGEAVNTVRREWYSMVGISLCAERWLDELIACIRALRGASVNESLLIMVGGQLFNECPDLAASVGADATAQDALQATLTAENLLTLRASRSV